MSIQKFMDAARTNTAIQNDLANASKASLIKIAKTHGFKITPADIDNAKNQRNQVAYSCGDVLWTGACSL